MKTQITIPLSAVLLSLVGASNASTVTLDAVNSGKFWYSGTISANKGIHADSNYRSFLQFDLASIETEITGATLEIGSHKNNSSGQTINLWDVTTSNLGVSSAGTFADLGGGTLFGTGVHTAGTVNSFALNISALLSLNAEDGIWAIGIQNIGSGAAFGQTWGITDGDYLKLILTTADAQGQVRDIVSVPEGGSVSAMLGLSVLGLCVFKRRIVQSTR